MRTGHIALALAAAAILSSCSSTTVAANRESRPSTLRVAFTTSQEDPDAAELKFRDF